MVVSPLMRGGNRYVALIGLEFIALAVLLALWLQRTGDSEAAAAVRRNRPLLLLATSPLVIALVHLLPLPPAWWDALPGHALLAQALQQAGLADRPWRGASVSPDATVASLLAGAPIVAALLVGYLASIRQLRVIMGAVVALAFAQVLLGLLQVAGGEFSPFYVGMLTFGAPIGSFANRNHFANYLAMALVALIWLAYESHRDAKIEKGVGTFGKRHRTLLFAAGGLVLVLGILMSRSRGGALFGLPMAVCALSAAALRIKGRAGLQLAVPIALLVVVAAIAMIGFDAATSRMTGGQLASSADFRGQLARTTFEGAKVFWPLGSGWGTYDLAYPRFQPASLPGYANQAHMDYVQMLFEGGVFFVVYAALFAWLLARRSWQLARRLWRDRTLDREAMACALCGMGLAVLLLHSLVDFNMRIPANAILGALLAGAFLRPLPGRRPAA